MACALQNAGLKFRHEILTYCILDCCLDARFQDFLLVSWWSLWAWPSSRGACWCVQAESSGGERQTSLSKTAAFELALLQLALELFTQPDAASDVLQVRARQALIIRSSIRHQFALAVYVCHASSFYF